MKDVTIIGAGIAGQTAAIYAARKKMDYFFLGKERGGQFMVSGEVLNYPGIIKTTGIEFSKTLQAQLEFNAVDLSEGVEVARIEKVDGGFRVISDKGKYESRTVIVATGAGPRRLDVPGEERLLNRGVTYCAICDGPLFSGQDIAIIGGGSSALEAVDFTQRMAKKIYVINNEERFTGHEYLIENLESFDNVEVIHGADTKEILGDKFVSGLSYEKDNLSHKLDVQGVIIEIGRIPRTDFMEGFLRRDGHKHIEIDCQGRTSVPGVFAAGDCASGHEYQYVISAGQGAMALLKAARYLAFVRE